MLPSTPPSKETCWLCSLEDALVQEVAAVSRAPVGPGGVTNELASQQWNQWNPDEAWRQHADREGSDRGANQHGRLNQKGLHLTCSPP